MNKQDIINIINEYELDKSRFVIISGAALVLLDIKESTNDIDISCDKDYYDYLLNNYDCKFERTNEYGENIYIINDIINFGTSFYPKNIELIKGIKCSSLGDILEVKKFLNREKDKEIIRKLEYILK